jgi:hypothetical protein
VTNCVPLRYRDVSVAHIDEPLTPEGLRQYFLGREAYRRTRYIVAQGHDEVAVVAVSTESRTPLFSVINEVSVLALPHESVMIHDPAVDCDIPNQLARVAEEQAPGARCVVVHGRYEHVSFILDPHRHEVRVVEVMPPNPPKLLDQAQRVIESASDLPPIRLVPVLVDLVDLAHEASAARYLLPCRGSGIAMDGITVAFLDERPPRQDWVQIGCARSREIHHWFYGSDARCVEMCPRVLARAHDQGPHITKCCLLEEDVELDGLHMTVPWGSSLDLVHEGLRRLAHAMEPAWSPA